MKLLRKIDILTDKKTNLWLNIGALLLILSFLFFFAWVALELLEEDEGLDSHSSSQQTVKKRLIKTKGARAMINILPLL